MSALKDDLSQVKSGTAVLFACVVQTLSESDPSFKTRFLEKLSAAYRDRRDDVARSGQHELELLAWTRELLTGFNTVSGQGKPFLED